MFEIILLNLKKFIFKNRSLFLIMLLTQIIAFICVMFTFGLTENALNSKIEAKYENTTFDVNLLTGDAEKYDDFDEIINDSYTFDEIKDKLKYIIEATDGEWNVFDCYGFVKSGDEYYGFYGVDQNEKYDFSLNNGFTQEDVMQGNCAVCVNDVSYPCKTGDKINIGSRTFTVADTDEYYYDSFIVPYKSLNNDFLIRRFEIRLNDIPTKQLVAKIGNAVVEQFGLDIDMLIPTVPDLMTEQYIRTAFLISFAAMLMIAVNVCYLNKYILNRQRKKLMVYRISGCGKIKLAGAYCVQTAIITLLAEFIGAAVFDCLLKNILGDMFGFREYFSGIIYFILLSVYLLVTAAAMLLTIVPYTNDTAAEMRGE